MVSGSAVGGGSCGAGGAGADAVDCSCGGGGSGRGPGVGGGRGRGRGGACGGIGSVVGACEAKRGGVKVVRMCWRGWVGGGWCVGMGDPNSVHAAGHHKKNNCCIASIVFDAHRFRCGSDFFFTPIAKPQC